MPEEFLPCTLHKISDHVWWFTPESRTDRPSLCAVVGEKGVVWLDIGASPAHTHQFLGELSQQGIDSPDYAVLSHWHWDHVFGIDAIDCPVIAQEETAKNIKRMMQLDYGDDNLPNLIKQGHEVEFTREHMVIELNNVQRQNLVLREPDITFSQSMTINLGDVSCDIQHVGGDHASDSTVIHIPEDGVLFLSDCFYYTVYQLPQHYTEAKILPLIDKLESFDATQYIMGHANMIFAKEDMQQEFNLLRSSYRLLAEHGQDNLEAIKAELYRNFDSEEVDETLESVVAGLQLVN